MMSRPNHNRLLSPQNDCDNFGRPQFEIQQETVDHEMTAIMSINSQRRSTIRSSKSANIILLCSSVFYLATNSLDLLLSIVNVLGMYPLCAMDQTTEITYACEPFRDFLRHSYFSFSFMFYVCLKLKRTDGFRRNRSSANGTVASVADLSSPII